MKHITEDIIAVDGIDILNTLSLIVRRNEAKDCTNLFLAISLIGCADDFKLNEWSDRMLDQGIDGIIWDQLRAYYNDADLVDPD